MKARWSVLTWQKGEPVLPYQKVPTCFVFPVAAATKLPMG